MANPQFPPTLQSPEPATATAITDALYRAVLAIDTNDSSLFDSAFTTSQPPTFTMFGTTHTGLDAIKTNVYDGVAKLDTTHYISNVRVNMADGGEGKEAKVTASALAYHYRPGEGVDTGKTERLLSGSLYELEVVREEGGEWRVKSWAMKVIWLEGDMKVITG